jgi:hypothetical protein
MPSYPRPAGKWWFGCSDAVKGKAVTHGNIQAADQPHAHDRDADLLDAGTDTEGRNFI